MDAIPGRMGLLFALLLCLVNILNSAVAQYPNNAEAMIHWIFSCIGFVVIAILEYALIIFSNNYKAPKKVCGTANRVLADKNNMKLLKHLDLLMIFISPIVFSIFTLMFWTT